MLFKNFEKEQLKCIETYSAAIPKTAEAFDELRALDIKIGATTGFSRDIVNVLLPLLSKQGVDFDYLVASNDVEHGTRPFPHMIYENMI